MAFGEGKKKGGAQQHQKTRLEALERVRAVGNLSPEQRNDWDYFRVAWDTKMADMHDGDWANIFAEILQNVVVELETENHNALSEFMYKETKRVLGDFPTLRFLVHNSFTRGYGDEYREVSSLRSSCDVA